MRQTQSSTPFDTRVGEVSALILDRQAWTQPIRVERTTLAVLDGHHRLTAAIRLGLARVSVRLYDYATVQLISWRVEITPTREEVLRRAVMRRLYPPKNHAAGFRIARTGGHGPTATRLKSADGPGLPSLESPLPGRRGERRRRGGALQLLLRHLRRA